MTAAVMVNQGLSNSWVLNTLSNFDGSTYVMNSYSTDNSGNIYQLSELYADASHARADCQAITKVRVDGSVVWQQVITGTSPNNGLYSFEFITALTNGNVAIAAWNYVYSPQSFNIAIIILSGSDGSIVTQKKITWPWETYPPSRSSVKGIHVDSSGNYYLVQEGYYNVAFYLTKLDSNFSVQYQIGSTSSDDFATAAYSADYKVKGFAGNSSGTTVTIQNYDTGSQSHPNRRAYTYVTVVNSSGSVVWKKWFNSTMAISVDIDSVGNVYCVLYQNQSVSYSPDTSKYIIVKFDTSGTVLWAKTINAPASVNDGTNYSFIVHSINATNESVFVNCSVTGYTVVGGTATPSRNLGGLLVFKLNSSDGSLIWKNKASLSEITTGLSGPYATVNDNTFSTYNVKNKMFSALDGQMKINGMVYYTIASSGSTTRQGSLFFKIPDNNVKTFTNLAIGNNTKLSWQADTVFSLSTYVWPTSFVYIGTSGVTYSSTPWTSTLTVSNYSNYWISDLQNVYITNVKTNIP